MLSLVTSGWLMGDATDNPGEAIVSLEASGLCRASSSETRLLELPDELRAVEPAVSESLFLCSVSKQIIKVEIRSVLLARTPSCDRELKSAW